MAQLYIQRNAEPDTWVMSGAPSATTLFLSLRTSINYSDGSSDTLPANTLAVLPDTTTEFDRTHDVYVGYTIQRSGILSVIKESLLPTLTSDYAPICRVELHGIKPYQPEPYLAAGGAGTSPTTTIVAVVSSVAARAASLWTGSANAAPPASWDTPGFDDSAWGTAVAAAYTAGAGYASVPGIVPIWATTNPASTSERCLLRQHFGLASGVPTAATLVIEADDVVVAVSINGAAIPASAAADVWPQTLSVPPGVLLPGGDNVIAVEGANLDPAGLGHASVDYQLSVTYAGSTAGSGATGGTSGGALTDPTTQPGDLVYRANSAAGTLVVGFMGDSITQGTIGGGATPTPTIAGNDLATATGRTVSVNNQGVSGTTSADWLPGGSHYSTAVAAFASAGVTIVHIVLGTNDAKTASLVPPATYRANMSAIAAALAAAGYTVVLGQPPYITPGALGQWDATSDTQLLAYQGAVAGIANGTTIRLGDTQAYSYFLAHQSELADGVHPTATGKTDLGQLWANALLAVVTALQRLTLGTGLSISGGVLSAGGSGGTVTSVSGTAPIVVATGSTTPVVSIATFGASGLSHAAGAVPDPGASAGSTRFLREDASWATVGGGSATLAGDSDVSIASPHDGDLLQYSASLGKWQNVTAPATAHWDILTDGAGNVIFAGGDTISVGTLH